MRKNVLSGLLRVLRNTAGAFLKKGCLFWLLFLEGGKEALAFAEIQKRPAASFMRLVSE